MFRLFLISCLIVGIHSMKPGRCPRVHGVPLDLDKLSSGIWWEYARNSDNWDGSERCAKQIWQLPEGGQTKIVEESYSLITDVTSRIVAEVQVLSDNGLSFDYYLPILGKKHETHTVMVVDYRDFAVSYYYENIEDYYKEKIWIMTRDPNPSIDIEMIVQRAFRRNGLLVPDFILIDNDNC